MTIDEAIEYGKEQLDVFGGKHAEFIKSVIELLEQGNIGEWLVEEGKDKKSHRYSGGHNCSNCKDYYTLFCNEMNYCPNCGAYMRRKDEKINGKTKNN